MRSPFQVSLFACYLAAICPLGCSTAKHQLGSGTGQLAVGQRYVLRRDAILLRRRGVIDSLENPDYRLNTYKPYKNYDPYDTQPLGVLPAGTVLKVKRIRVFKNGYFDVEGEILSGTFKRQPVSVSDGAKGFTVGGWPPTGRVTMEKLCGNKSFDPAQLARNLSKAAN